MIDARFRLTEAPARAPDLAAEVRAGLAAVHKSLPCRFFYDAEGSRLFEEICALPEYYLTRAEREIFVAHAGAIAARVAPGTTLVEFGSGSASKTRLLIEAIGVRRYVPIDISLSALEESARELLTAFPSLEIAAVAGEYRDGLAALARGGPTLVLWLGSNVGNFTRPEAAEFLGRLDLGTGDRLLMGVDLRKDRAVLEAAYDDSRGVTARFNLNLLARINRDLGGTFDLAAFRHRARYDELEGRIEMYLDSVRAQRVRIADYEVAFAADEPIHTEDSYKYSFDEIDGLARAAGLRVEARWTDSAGRFAEVLLAP